MTAITVVVPTRSTDDRLHRVLRSLEDQTLSPERCEVIVADDGSAPARNLGLFMAASPVVLFLAHDEVVAPGVLEEHVRAHAEHDGTTTCVVGATSWSPDLPWTPLLHFLRGVERLPLSYPDAPTEPLPDFAHFRARHLSVKRDFLARYAAFDETFAPLDDVELGYRLHRNWGLDLHHRPAATSTRTSCPTFTEWSEHTVAEGRAIARIAATHPGDDMQGHCRIDSALEHWRQHGSEHAALRARIAQLELDAGTDSDELWLAYRACFDLDRAQGIAG